MFRQFTYKAVLPGAFAVMAFNAYAATMSAQDFVTKASGANQFEISTSKLALERSKNEDVRSFAQMMVDDHMATGKKLKLTLADSGSEAKPAKKLDGAHQKKLDSLKQVSAEQFDARYIDLQTDAHREAVALFKNYSINGEDSALTGFAKETLPALKEHLAQVQKLNP